MKAIINEEALAKVAKELEDRENGNGEFYAQINYDMEDGDIWVDWNYGRDWVQYRSSDIITIPWDSVENFAGVTQDGKLIDLKKGLRTAIEREVWIEKHYA